MSSPTPPVGGVRLSLWRAAVAFRIVAALFCEYLILRWHQLYPHLAVAVAAGIGIALVTGAVAVLGGSGRAHRAGFVAADLLATLVLTGASHWAQTPTQSHGGMPTLTTVWAAGPVIEAGLVFGWLGGAAIALVQFGSTVLVRHGYDGDTVKNGVLLLITGGISGYLSTLTERAERERAQLAALAERDRLARSIHDGVLQVLALVHRKAADAGEDWSELGQAAAEQEAALRGLITARPQPVMAGTLDLLDELARLRTARVTVSVPGDPLPLPAGAVTELVAVVRAALHNVEQHAGAGARAWVLAEQLPGRVRLTVRDDGQGFDAHRLDQARAAGRLGVAGSIRGRVAELGGSSRISSVPGSGTELEIEIPTKKTKDRLR